MDFIVKKTTECSQSELNEMNDLFNKIFDRDRSLQIMLNQYTKNPLGYSYHSLIFDNSKIVGMNVYIPVYFQTNGKKVLFADSIDSMVDKPYRDYFNYHDMVTAAYKYMKAEGVKFVYGYPNDMAYPVVIKSKLMKEMGRMYTYCLPYRIGGVRPSLKCFNCFSELLCWLWVSVSSIFASAKKASYVYEKNLETYNLTRYKRNDGLYSLQDGFVYKIQEFEGVRAAFLIDVFEKSGKNFCKAVKYILKYEKRNFDILIYPGFLKFGFNGLIKIPHIFEPKHFVLTGKLLDKQFDSLELWTIDNWDTNLSNYDLI